MKIIDNGIKICPICKKQFLYNPTSIYKISKGGKVMNYCRYTCWRKAGGDSGKSRRGRQKI